MPDATANPLLDQAKFFREHIQTVLNLATGAFVVSVTFLEKHAKDLHARPWLRWSWILLVIAILLGLAYNYVLSIYVRKQGSDFATLLSVLSFFFHTCFFGAMFCLLRFGLANIPA